MTIAMTLARVRVALALRDNEQLNLRPEVTPESKLLADRLSVNIAGVFVCVLQQRSYDQQLEVMKSNTNYF